MLQKQSVTMTQKQLRRWAFTIWLKNETEIEEAKINAGQLMETLLNKAKRFTFQLEMGEESKKLHLQGRISLGKPIRPSEIHKQIPIEWGTWHLSPEVDEKESNFYAQKEETRIAGPWSDQPTEECYIPSQYKITEYNKWQKQFDESMIEQNMRQILFICDEKGGRGKSTYALNKVCQGTAIWVPSTMENTQQMMEWVYGFVTNVKQQYYIFIDVPRAVNGKDTWRKWLSSMECLKGGITYDHRYTAKMKLFEWPKIAIFSNSLPPEGLLSRDRYQIIQIMDEAS